MVAAVALTLGIGSQLLLGHFAIGRLDVDQLWRSQHVAHGDEPVAVKNHRGAFNLCRVQDLGFQHKSRGSVP